ncbi:MAG: 2TM domain-containing protein [Scytonema sp. PMC 1069.18]|nr:2TM domain-containing protein [Scytonema sp. PMC 1069.18]MEC4882374.1 2TM domain-containing protein [Scytonema sp. PMC 1070.18]
MTAFNDKVNRTYSQEDVQQILHLAIAHQANDQNQEFSYQQLVEIAEELNISSDLLRQAERDWVEQQGEMQQRQAFNTYRQSKFKRRFGKYTIFNIFLVSLDMLTDGGLSWSLYILLGCGFALGLDAWNTFQTQGEEYEMAFQRWRRNHQVKKFFNTVVNKWLKAWQM